MSFFNSLFGGSEAAAPKGMWHYLESEQDLDQAVQQSHGKKVVIFKHSTQCGVSRMVLKNFEKEISSVDKDAVFYYLDLLKYRPLSNKIELDFGVRHQSPQMIVLVNGQAVANASHQDVSADII